MYELPLFYSAKPYPVNTSTFFDVIAHFVYIKCSLKTTQAEDFLQFFNFTNIANVQEMYISCTYLLQILESLCDKKFPDLFSPVVSRSCLPIASIKFLPLAFHGPHIFQSQSIRRQICHLERYVFQCLDMFSNV